jgi:hypothetical protein
VVVSYLQYAYIDSRQPASYQLAYVLHPASLWESFGPIRLAVSVPEGIGARASVAWTRSAPPPAQTAQANAPAHAAVQTAAAPKSSAGVFSADLDIPFGGATAAAAPGATPAGAVYRATLTEPAQKTGELFIALDKAAWDQAAKAKLDAEKAKLEAEKARANPGANRSG